MDFNTLIARPCSSVSEGRISQIREQTLGASFKNIIYQFSSKAVAIREKGKACQSHARHTWASYRVPLLSITEQKVSIRETSLTDLSPSVMSTIILMCISSVFCHNKLSICGEGDGFVSYPY